MGRSRHAGAAHGALGITSYEATTRVWSWPKAAERHCHWGLRSNCLWGREAWHAGPGAGTF
eukprot:6996195-Pyramimonas_sp.AAC.1